MEKVPYKIERCEETGDVVVRAINSTDHLCNICSSSFAECKPEILNFGDGLGNDNVIACSECSVLSAEESLIMMDPSKAVVQDADGTILAHARSRVMIVECTFE